MSRFDGLLALSDAGRKWDKNDGYLRHAIQHGKFKEGEDCMKIGKQWIITEEAMRREYGDPK